jgi:putative DNA primase/helicase
MTALTLREIAAALGGELSGSQVLAPGPGHSLRDRSMALCLSPDAPDGFIVNSFAGDDWRTCRDHVRERLRLPVWNSQISGFPKHSPRASLSHLQRRQLAAAAWDESSNPPGTPVVAYLRSRGLDLPEDVAGEAIRFHPACPWRENDRTIRVPAMIAAMRAISSDEIVGVHRTRLTTDGRKIDRRMLGSATAAAIKLDADAHVTLGLTIGEGLETCLAGRQLGLRPVWALGSAGAIAAFPVLPGIEAVAIHAEHDIANAKAVEECGERWAAAGREVIIVRPLAGNDVNDAIREVAA